MFFRALLAAGAAASGTGGKRVRYLVCYFRSAPAYPNEGIVHDEK